MTLLLTEAENGGRDTSTLTGSAGPPRHEHTLVDHRTLLCGGAHTSVSQHPHHRARHCEPPTPTAWAPTGSEPALLSPYPEKMC